MSDEQTQNINPEFKKVVLVEEVIWENSGGYTQRILGGDGCEYKVRSRSSLKKGELAILTPDERDNTWNDWLVVES